MLRLRIGHSQNCLVCIYILVDTAVVRIDSADVLADAADICGENTS